MGRVPDEAGHGLGYLVFSLTLVAGATSSFRSRLTARTAWLLWLLAVLYGISDEFHQSFVPGRNPSLGDLLVDALGAGVGLLGSWLVWRPRRG